MREIYIGQEKYIQSADQLYRYSAEAADAATRAEWARCILDENNGYLASGDMGTGLG